MAVATPGVGTSYGKELAKWEQHRTRFTDDDNPPGNPYVFRMYPRMMFRAVKHPKTGQMVCMAVPPNPMLFTTPHEYDRACLDIERMNRECSRTVNSDEEFRIAKNDGWRESPALALETHEQQMCAVAEETARRHFSDQRLSPEAQAEAARIDASTEHQVPDVQTEQARQKARR